MTTLRGRLTLLYAALMGGALLVVGGSVAAVIAYDLAEDNAENLAHGLAPESFDPGQRLLLFGLGVGLPIVLALGAAGGWVIAGRALGPLREIARVVDDVSADRLDQRLATGGGAEVNSLATSLNQLLGRLERSLLDVRRFTADAAHELRTPLGAVMGQLEVALRHPRDEGDLRESIAGSLEELGRMKVLLEALLTLARIDERTLSAADEVDLTALAARLVERDRPFAEDRAIALELLGDAPVHTRGDRQLLERAVGNLLQNALGHGSAGGRVAVRVNALDRWARIVIEDDGPGVPEGDRGHLFERFFRGDAARARGPGTGFGLGLSIARGIVESHRGRVGYAPREGGGSTFTVDLPRTFS